MTALVSCSDLSVSYGQVRALHGVSLELPVGITGLVGPNGAGKSTLLRCLASTQLPDQGRVCHRGRELTGAAVDEYRHSLGYLPQSPRWHGWMTVRECLELFAWLRRLPRSHRPPAASRAMEQVSLETLGEVRIDHLSGGQHQRLMLATALVADPEVLILDEPTVGLDPEQRYEIRSLVKALAAERALCLSTHLMEDVAITADRIAVLDQGEVIFAGPQQELLALAGERAADATNLEAAYMALLRSRR